MSKSHSQVSSSGFNYISKSTYFESKHKSFPAKFASIEEGRIKRAENHSLLRKSARISVFDNARNMSPLVSPVPVSNDQGKSQRRRLLLQQWKQEKEKKKKEEASKSKKKPFIVGAVRAPLTFEPPPPVKPVTSARVTRSQSVKNKNPPPPPSKTEATNSQGRVVICGTDFFARLNKQANMPSFAPVDAVFHAPSNLDPKLPNMFKNNNKSKTVKPSVTFDPVIKSNSSNKQKPTLTKATNTRKVQNTVSQSVKILNAKQKISPPVKTTDLKELNQNTRVTRQNSKTANNKSVVDKLFDLRNRNENQNVPVNKDIPFIKVTSDVQDSEAKATPEKSSKKAKITPKTEVMPEKTIQKKLTPTRIKSPEVPKSESQVEERLRTPEEKKVFMEELVTISPCVTMSRGKKNARREVMDKIKDGRLSFGTGDGKTAADFRNQLNSETSRLTAISDEWDTYSKNNVLPDHIQELVLAGVGQTRLLLAKKFQQFAELVDLCESGRARAEGVVTSADLQGFWDMLFMQVEDVDMRFKKLNDLREHQWALPVQEVKQKKKNTTNIKKKIISGPSSQIRAMIEAARKAAQSQKSTPPSSDAPESKRFEAGFFSVTSPVRPPPPPVSLAPSTPASKPSMLKEVLSAEAKKANSVSKGSASRAMMMASLISKNMGSPVTLARISPRLSPIMNLEATPARSILKTPQQRSTRKSVKIVLFNDKPSTLNEDGFKALALTPEKQDINPTDAEDNKVRRTRKSKGDQENLTPGDSPPRRVTRNMRRSILQEKQNSEKAAEVEIAGKRTSRNRSSSRISGQLTEVR